MDCRKTSTFEKELQPLGLWNQHFECPNGVKTGDGQPLGYNAQKLWSFIEAIVPDELTGKTILDVGGNAGFFSIQMKPRGTQTCVLVDPFEISIKAARPHLHRPLLLHSQELVLPAPGRRQSRGPAPLSQPPLRRHLPVGPVTSPQSMTACG